MIPITKYDRPGFDRAKTWSDRYRTMYASEKSIGEYEQQSFWPELKKRLQQDGMYLDAGCGIGGWVLFLNELKYKTEGIDPNSGAIRAMSEYDPDLSLKIASTSAIPYKNEQFDGVLSIGSLEYSEGEVETSLREMHRVTKSGGFVCIEVPLANTLRRLFYIPLKRLEGLVKSGTQKPTFVYHLFGKEELEGLITNYGFSIEVVLPHDLPDPKSHFGLYSNWPFLRGSKPYELNILGRIIKIICNGISPWIASTGIVVIAKKK
jgi:ubiquinone/menaquinone biosynthesis C-methylase UbiE